MGHFLRNVAKLGLVALGGVLGIIAMAWSRANAEWVAVRLPSSLIPGNTSDLEYEAQLFSVVGISFIAGVICTMWLALTVWLRAHRRERNLAKSLDQVERQIEATRALHKDVDRPTGGALPERALDTEGYEEFEELQAGDGEELLSGPDDLPEGYEQVS